MTRDSSNRPSAAELINHEWIQQHTDRQLQHRLSKTGNDLIPSPFSIHVDATGTHSYGMQASSIISANSVLPQQPRHSAAKHGRSPSEPKSLEAAFSTLNTDDNRIVLDTSDVYLGDLSGKSGLDHLKRIKSVLTPRGTWLKKFSIKKSSSSQCLDVEESEDNETNDSMSITA